MPSKAPSITELIAAPALLAPLVVYCDSRDNALREMVSACGNFLALELVAHDDWQQLPRVPGVWLRESASCVLPASLDGSQVIECAILTIMPEMNNTALVSVLNQGMNVCLFRPVTKVVLRGALEQLRERLSWHVHQAGLYDRLQPLMVCLTARERSVLVGLRQGETTKVLARNLGVSQKTVQAYRYRLLKRFNASSSTHLALLAAWWEQCLLGQFSFNAQVSVKGLPKSTLSPFKTAWPNHA